MSMVKFVLIVALVHLLLEIGAEIAYWLLVV